MAPLEKRSESIVLRDLVVNISKVNVKHTVSIYQAKFGAGVTDNFSHILVW